MDSTEFPKSAALVTLLKEIEMLLGELRSLESHVQRAQELTAERIAQLQSEHQRELAVLRSALLSRDQSRDIQETAGEASGEAHQPFDLVTELKEEIRNEEHVAMKTDEHDPENTGATTAHQKAAASSEAEQNLRDEIVRLRQEAQERNQILQDRNDELVRVKLQLDQLQERMAQLESSLPDESSADSQVDRMRTEFQAQLALLQAELSQKEWAFEERQAEACGRELQLRQQITALRKQLIATHRERDQRDVIFGEDGNDPAEKDLAPNGDEGELGHGRFAAQRRWNSGFGRKRRWRF